MPVSGIWNIHFNGVGSVAAAGVHHFSKAGSPLAGTGLAGDPSPRCRSRARLVAGEEILEADRFMTGEHLLSPGGRSLVVGSPPRVRGTRHVRRPHHREYGSPRAYGEHTGTPLFGSDSSGSPPRVRGALLYGDSLGVGHRITPRVRGAQVVRGGRQPVARITPACAGSTRRWRPPRSTRTDHPACAGSTGSDEGEEALWADHPRVRGGHFRSSKQRPGGGRITPACAGSTLPCPPHPGARVDHPRVCGEYVTVFVLPCVTIGSPPRVRGGWYVRVDVRR